MPLSRIEIEQLGPGRWVAEVEAGGTSAVRRHVTALNFDEIVLAVVEAHAELTAPPAVKAPPVQERAGPWEMVEVNLPSHEELREVIDASEREEDELPSREALLAEADRLGINVDRRLGAARLQVIIHAVGDAPAKAGE